MTRGGDGPAMTKYSHYPIGQHPALTSAGTEVEARLTDVTTIYNGN